MRSFLRVAACASLMMAPVLSANTFSGKMRSTFSSSSSRGGSCQQATDTYSTAIKLSGELARFSQERADQNGRQRGEQFVSELAHAASRLHTVLSESGVVQQCDQGQQERNSIALAYRDVVEAYGPVGRADHGRSCSCSCSCSAQSNGIRKISRTYQALVKEMNRLGFKG